MNFTKVKSRPHHQSQHFGLLELVKKMMSSRTNQQLLQVALIPVTCGAFFVGIASLVSIFIWPFTFYNLFLLPVALVNFVVVAYSNAWILYLQFAQHDKEFFLPYEPKRVLKVNSGFIGLFQGINSYIFLFFECVRLRFFPLGKGFNYANCVVKENIPYGSRVTTNSLDVYTPEVATRSDNARHPVIVFIYGGAWSSGHKIMYMLLALRLAQQGYVVVVPNYTLYPKSKIEGMVSDVKRALFWTKENISDFGGDHDSIHAMGHSAGAHILALLTVRDAMHKLRNNVGKDDIALHDIDPDCALPKIAGLILMSGVYDVPNHYEWETARGFEEISAMARAMGGSQESLVKSSPTLLIQNFVKNNETNVHQLKNLMPQKILVMHGDLDVTVPVHASISFGMALKDLSIENLKLKIYPGMEHAEPVTGIMQTTKFSAEMLADLSDFIAS